MKWQLYYAEIANMTANLSTANKLKVGCVITKDNRILSIGYNGTPSGWENVCEEKQWLESDAGMWLDAEDIEEEWPFKGYRPDVGREMRYKLKSKPEVLHAEANALMKLCRSTESSDGATLYVTHYPCIECAKLIYQSGIKEVYYINDYEASKGSGKEFLFKAGVNVCQVKKQ
jgi:dCMP deaminase